MVSSKVQTRTQEIPLDQRDHWKDDVKIEKIPTYQNIADPLTKPFPEEKYESHVLAYGMRYKGDWL